MTYDFAVDWDDTLVDIQTQEWLPDAKETLRWLLGQGFTVVIHTCRANWSEGVESVRRALRGAGLSATLWTGNGKPQARCYIGNNYLNFAGDWRPIRDLIEHAVPPQQTGPTLTLRGARRRQPARKLWH